MRHAASIIWEAAMWIVHSGRWQSLRRSPLKCVRWMSPTSHLDVDPFGAAVARSPHPASGGGGEGSIPLVSPSEFGRQQVLWRGQLRSSRSRWRLLGIAKAGENVVVRDAGTVCQDVGFSPPVRNGAGDELDQKSGAAVHRFAGEQRRIARDARMLCRHGAHGNGGPRPKRSCRLGRKAA